MSDGISDTILKKKFDKAMYKDFRKVKIITIMMIKDIIKQTPNIKLDMLLAKLNIEEPYLSKRASYDYIKDMVKVGQVKIDKKTKEVTICQ